MTGHNHGRTSRKSGWKAVREYRISTRRTMVTLGIWMGLGSDLDGAWKVDPNALPTIVSRDLPKSFGTAIFAVGCFIGTTLWLPTENIPMNQLDLQKGLSGEGAFSVGCWNLSQTTLQHDRFTALGSFTWTLQIRLCIVQKILNVRHVVFGQIFECCVRCPWDSQELEFYRTAGPVEWAETNDGYQWKWRQPANTFWDERWDSYQKETRRGICRMSLDLQCINYLKPSRRLVYFRTREFALQAKSLRPRAERCGSKSKS